ncbi:MAG: S8 family serine peptidase [archaeon]
MDEKRGGHSVEAVARQRTLPQFFLVFLFLSIFLLLAFVGAAVRSTDQTQTYRIVVFVPELDDGSVPVDIDDSAAYPQDHDALGRKTGGAGIVPRITRREAIGSIDRNGQIGAAYRAYKVQESLTKSLPIGIKSRLRHVKDFSALRGFSAEATEQDIERLRAEPGILVFEDRIFNIDPDPPGVPFHQTLSMDNEFDVIGVADVRGRLNLTGAGITVAVLDTGVDYTHADFGACESPGGDCRVTVGRDLANDDTDPQDDNGHGTHVAGIVGGAGAHGGVAPNASIIAIKVCSGGGSCPSTAMIDGVDFALGQGADIIHMSLGGAAYPNSPYADAVSMVVAAVADMGIPVVIAAGNVGPGVETVSAPGSARNIITVGAAHTQGTASLDDDYVVGFSSRGPSAFGRLDPDILAPGVSICSAKASAGGGTLCGDSTHVYSSGTSMAAPFVSGALALMLEHNSSWRFSDLKKRLFSSASALSEGVFDQGAGMINVSAAIRSTFLFSVDDRPFIETWAEPGANVSIPITLENLAGTLLSINFTADNLSDQQGINILPVSRFSLPDSAAIPAYSQSTATLVVSVPPEQEPGTYGGYLLMENGGQGSWRMPLVVTVPVMEADDVLLTVDHYCSGCWSSITAFGDWVYYPFVTRNGTGIDINLSWGDSAQDLDLYMFAPSSDLITVSGAGGTTSERIIQQGLRYDRYWLAIHTYTLTMATQFNLSFRYLSNLSVSPSSPSATVFSDTTQELQLTVTNDPTPRNVSVRVMFDQETEGCSVSVPITDTFGSVVHYLNFSSFCPHLLGENIVNITASWEDSTLDANLYIDYRIGGSWSLAGVYSRHNNTLSGVSSESIIGYDLSHGYQAYDDVGIGFLANGAGTINVTVMPVTYWNASTALVPRNSTLVFDGASAVGLTLDINTSGLSLGSHAFSLKLDDGSSPLATIPIPVVVLSNSPPIISWYEPNLSLSVPENSTTLFNQTSSDADGHQLSVYWLLDAVLVSTDGNFTFSPGFGQSGNLTLQLIISDAVENTSIIWNITVTDVNRAPVFLSTPGNVSINETDLFSVSSLNLSYSDPDNDSISVNYTWPLNTSGEWQTDISSSGSYPVNITLSDGLEEELASFVITVSGLSDADDDGLPDDSDPDDDNDGLNDSIDQILGNASWINTTTITATLFVGNSTNITRVLNGTLKVEVKDNGTVILSFPFNFSAANLSLAALRIERETDVTSSIIVAGLTLPEGQTKNVTLSKLNSSVDAVCIRDVEPGVALNITGSCTGENETFVACDGNVVGSYTCSLVEVSLFQVTGLIHSEVRQQCADQDLDGYGLLGCGTGTDCDDSDAAINPGADEVCGDDTDNDCDGDENEGCATVQSNPGGGGGGGGFRPATTSTNTTNSSADNSTVGQPSQDADSTDTDGHPFEEQSPQGTSPTGFVGRGTGDSDTLGLARTGGRSAPAIESPGSIPIDDDASAGSSALVSDSSGVFMLYLLQILLLFSLITFAVFRPAPSERPIMIGGHGWRVGKVFEHGHGPRQWKRPELPIKRPVRDRVKTADSPKTAGQRQRTQKQKKVRAHPR